MIAELVMMNAVIANYFERSAEMTKHSVKCEFFNSRFSHTTVRGEFRVGRLLTADVYFSTWIKKK